MEEYIVVAKDHQCLQSLYDDLETSGGTSIVPERCVECCRKKPASRSTHYMLNQEEVEALLNDDRVEGIDCKRELDQEIKVSLYEQQ